VGFETGLGRLFGIGSQRGNLLARRGKAMKSWVKIPCLDRASTVKVNLQDRVLRQTFRTPANSSPIISQFPSLKSFLNIRAKHNISTILALFLD
jgi:hypothetical protein